MRNITINKTNSSELVYTCKLDPITTGHKIFNDKVFIGEDIPENQIATIGYVQRHLEQTNSELLYKQIFKNLCKENLDKQGEYELLLKLNEYNFRQTVLSIETSNQ